MDEKALFGNNDEIADPPNTLKTAGVKGFDNLTFEGTYRILYMSCCTET